MQPHQIHCIFKSRSGQFIKIGTCCPRFNWKEWASSSKASSCWQSTILTHTSLYRQEIYWPKWLILYRMMHDRYNNAFAATNVAFKIWRFLKTNYLNIK